MDGDIISGANRISRFVKRTQILDDGSVDGSAFLTKKEEEYASVNWIDFLQLANHSEEVAELRYLYAKKLKIRPQEIIAILESGSMIDYVRLHSDDSRELGIRHKPNRHDPSHSGIFGLTWEDDLIGDLISDCIVNTFPAA